MNDETKLFLLLLLVAAVGAGLVTYGFGWSVRTACIASGLLAYVTAMKVLSILYRK